MFFERFGISIHQVFGELLENLKNANLIEETENFIRFTAAGLIIAEEVASMFYSEEVQKKLEEFGDKFGRNGL